MFIGGTHTVQFDNVLKSKHRLSVQNRELTLNSMQGRESLNGTHYIQRHYTVLHLSFDLVNLIRMLRYGHCRFHCVPYQCILLFHSWPAFKVNGDPLIRIQEFDDYPFTFMKDIQATCEVFIPQKRTYSICHKIDSYNQCFRELAVGIQIRKVKQTARQCLYRLLALSYNKQDATCNDLSVLFKRKNR